MRRGWPLFLALLLLAFALPVAARAVTVEEISKQLMDPCENCKGKLLASCDCGPAAELKVEIQKLIDSGQGERAILDSVVRDHGEWIRAAPEKKGFNLLGWIFPFVLIAAGAAGILAFLRRAVVQNAPHPAAARTGDAPQSTAAPERDDDYYRRVLDRELRALER